jgi:hypothetical protein
MAKNNYVPPREIVCIVGDVRYSGFYGAQDGIVKVDWENFTKQTQAGTNPIETARRLLRELVREHSK